MRLGELDRRIDIYSISTAKDAYGSEIPTESLLATVWAQQGYIISKEKINNAEPLAPSEVQWMIRYRDDITATCHIKYKKRKYNILHIQELDRNRFMLITTVTSDNVLS